MSLQTHLPGTPHTHTSKRKPVITDFSIPQMGGLSLSRPAESYTPSRRRLGPLTLLLLTLYTCQRRQIPQTEVSVPRTALTSFLNVSQNLQKALPCGLDQQKQKRDTQFGDRALTKLCLIHNRETGHSAKSTHLESSGQAERLASCG